LVKTQIWLNQLMDDQHLGYIKTLGKLAAPPKKRIKRKKEKMVPLHKSNLLLLY